MDDHGLSMGRASLPLGGSVAFDSQLATYIPRTKQTPHTTEIWSVNTENSIRNGPGQRQPMPQPSPKVKAPPTSFQSIVLFEGLKRSFPRKDCFLQ